MLILTVTYKVPLEQVEPLSAPHMEWVKQGYERGWFLASGRKVPRTGGVILARGPRQEIEAFLAEDPFITGNVADYDIVEVAFTTTMAGLDALKDDGAKP